MSNTGSAAAPTSSRVERTEVCGYASTRREPSRPSSKGGNTKALDGHALIIDDTPSSVLALGSRKRVFATDTVAFDWAWDPSHQRRRVGVKSTQLWDKTGTPVVRGGCGCKPTPGTAEARPPGRRSEWQT